MAILRTTKALAKQIDLTYFKKKHGFRTLKKTLSWVFPLLAAIWIAVESSKSFKLYQNGPVSSQHQLFGLNCDKCHVEWGEFNSVNKGDSSVPDWKCQECHQGPPHHWVKLPTKDDKGKPLPNDPACMVCHQEHRGHTELVKLHKQKCTDCHKALNEKFRAGHEFKNVRKVGMKVSSFTDGHPQFKNFEGEDPGKVNYNHQVHLREGLAGLPEGIIRLECDDCHKVDSAGRYMQAISYETNCATCHPLESQVGRLPHESPAEIRAFLRGNVSHMAINDHAKVTVGKKSRRKTKQIPLSKAFHEMHAAAGIIAENKDDKDKVESTIKKLKKSFKFEEVKFLLSAEFKSLESWGQLLEDEHIQKLHAASEKFASLTEDEKHQFYVNSIQTWIDSKRQVLEGFVYGKGSECQRCHQITIPEEPDAVPVVAPTNIPNRWYPHSKFAHKPHSVLRCEECHTKTAESTSANHVLMPGIETCKQCHLPAANQAGADCVECHNFHDRTTATRFEGSQTINDLLKSYKSSGTSPQ